MVLNLCSVKRKFQCPILDAALYHMGPFTNDVMVLRGEGGIWL